MKHLIFFYFQSRINNSRKTSENQVELLRLDEVRRATESKGGFSLDSNIGVHIGFARNVREEIEPNVKAQPLVLIIVFYYNVD